jgi:hypothetical protein
VANIKVVDLKKLNNFHVGKFSSCYTKSKVILEILFCPIQKFGFEFEFQNGLANLANFHAELALATKICFVVHKILYNFYFGEILALVQTLAVFAKGQNGEDMDVYSNRYAPRRSVQARPPLAQRRLRA